MAPLVAILRLSAEVFRDEDSISLGHAWEESIAMALNRCTHVLVFWSRAAGSSRWVAKEIDAALKDTRKLVIPVLLDDTPLPTKLERFQRVSLNDWRGATTPERTEDADFPHGKVRRWARPDYVEDHFIDSIESIVGSFGDDDVERLLRAEGQLFHLLESEERHRKRTLVLLAANGPIFILFVLTWAAWLVEHFGRH